MNHPSDDLLDRFTDCELSEQDAVAVALHLDRCPACSTRVFSLDPLAPAFAATEDPLLEEDLTDAILTVLDRGGGFPKASRTPYIEVFASLALLSAAAMVLILLGEPAGLATDAALATTGALTAAWFLLSQLTEASTWWIPALATLGFVFCLSIATSFWRRPLPFFSSWSE